LVKAQAPLVEELRDVQQASMDLAESIATKAQEAQTFFAEEQGKLQKGH